MYKVFVNDKVIYFTKNKENLNKDSNGLKLNFFSPSLTKSIYGLVSEDEQINYVIIAVENPELAFNEFKNYFQSITAAGGIVKNEKGETLFIYRLDKWDLPKGKMEIGENTLETALREVEEECGVTGLAIERRLKDTFHIYEREKKVYLKETHWYAMNTNFKGQLIPQLEEGITEVAWLGEEEIKTKVLKNTYTSILDLWVSVG